MSNSKEISPRKPGKNDKDRYETERSVALSDDLQDRLQLASSSQTHKEILYYMAEHDQAPEVREAVARNSSMPVQASTILSIDQNVDVRLALAERLVYLLPDLDEDKHSQLYAFVVQAMGDLALDEVLKVRKALAETLKDHAHTPPKIASQLAKDLEREVSEPILRFCSALADRDLLEILKTHPESWAIQAIAARENVSEEISEAVIDTEDRPAGQILLENKGANISVSTLEIIIEKSKTYPEWQKPVSGYRSLSREMAKRLMEFVDSSIKTLLETREFFDTDTTEKITTIVKRRIDFESQNEMTHNKSPENRVQEFAKSNTLNDETVSDAIAMRDYDFVEAALAHLIKADAQTIQRVFRLRKAKLIIALSWKAGLSMRTALQMQKEIANIHPKELIYPRDGTDYPLSQDDMEWQLDFLDL